MELMNTTAPNTDANSRSPVSEASRWQEMFANEMVELGAAEEGEFTNRKTVTLRNITVNPDILLCLDEWITESLAQIHSGTLVN